MNTCCLFGFLYFLNSGLRIKSYLFCFIVIILTNLYYSCNYIRYKNFQHYC
jgi:hypothetical protein